MILQHLNIKQMKRIIWGENKKLHTFKTVRQERKNAVMPHTIYEIL